MSLSLFGWAGMDVHGCSVVESSVPRPRVSWSWICSGFLPSWSVLVSVEPPCWCGNALPLLQQDLAPALARCWLIVYSLTGSRSGARRTLCGRTCPVPIPIPPLAVAWVSFTLATSASKPPVERAWIFFFH